MSSLPKIAYKKNAALYKILANAKRLEILNLLRVKAEMSLEEITKTVGARKANISQHLSLLKHTGLVRSRRSGSNAYYRIADPRIVEPCRILHQLRKKNACV